MLPNWPALILSPTLALLNLTAIYALVTPSCHRQSTGAMQWLTAASLLLSLLFTFIAWRNARRLGAPPDLLWGTVNTVLLVVSALPNYLAKKAAEKLDLKRVRLWIVVSMAFALLILVVRAFEFPALNTRWDSQAYGSVLWMLMALHTVHLITDAYDTLVLTVLMFIGPLEGKRYGDVSENAMYWFFVVLSWLPLYAVVYWAPRF